jgi:hypothetical protein
MKSLKEALVDYDLALLQALAHKRGLETPQTRSPEVLNTFVEALLSPVSIAIAVSDLSAEEKEALKHLISAGNVLEAPKFSRLYGSIRPMGSNKLLREKPWQSPANPAEGLWYRGLIFKGFHHTINGPEEVIFIPDDLQASLPLTPTAPPAFQIDLASTPTIILPATQAAREDLFSLLVYLQTNIVRLAGDGEIPPGHLGAIQAQFSQHYPDDAEAANHWLAFIRHLAQRLNFLQRQGQRLKLNAPAVRHWLQQSAWAQSRQLQDIWRSDPTWNDLWHVPGLHPQKTGWENSPLLGRAKILHYLAQLPADEWISIEQFVQAIKKTEPDFQRPNGDYQNWYIYDTTGKALIGFEHWEAVEGGLIRYILRTLLFGLGVVDLGAPAETVLPTTFRTTRLGQAFFSPDTPPEEPGSGRRSTLKIDPTNFNVRVPHEASLYDRFQLARFAKLIRREEKQIIYQITRESYHKALEQSITLEQILAFLARATTAQTPLAVVEAMRNWDRRSGAVKLERLTVLRVNQDDLVSELLNHPKIGPLLDRPLGPRTVLIPEKNVGQLRKLLSEFGYLDSG